MEVVDQVKGQSISASQYIIDTYGNGIPTDIKEVFKVARVIVTCNEVIAPVARKISEIPVTNIMYESNDKKSESAKNKLKKIFETDLNIRDQLTSIGFDNFGYANAFCSLYFMPVRYLSCPECDANAKKNKSKSKLRWRAENIDWKIKIEPSEKNNKNKDIFFYGNCPKCNKHVKFNRKDVYYSYTKSLRLIKWDPFQIDIDHYKHINESYYFYRHTKEEVLKIAAGDKIMLTKYPWSFLEAAINGKLLRIEKKGFFHFKNESVSGMYEGWGTPKILSVISALYTLATLTKANEAASKGRINDLTIISPSARGGGSSTSSDPLAGIGVNKWTSQVNSVLKAFKKDKTLTALLPFPVQADSVYGHGRSQLVTSELTLYIRNIIAAMGLPEDIIYSGGNYTSIAVAARILENEASTRRKRYNEFLSFVKDSISSSLKNVDFTNVTVKLEPYESPDDLNKINMMISMAMNGKYPWKLIYKRFGQDYEQVMSMLTAEAEDFAKIQILLGKGEGKSVAANNAIIARSQMMQQSAMEKMQGLFQNQMAEQGGREAAGDSNLQQKAQSMAEDIINTYEPSQWQGALENIASLDQQLASAVFNILKQYSMNSGNAQDQSLSGQQEIQRLPNHATTQYNGDGGEVLPLQTIGTTADKRAPRGKNL